MSPEELDKLIDGQIALHTSTIDRLKMVASEMSDDDVKVVIIRELLKVANQLLYCWQLDRKGRLGEEFEGHETTD